MELLLLYISTRIHDVTLQKIVTWIITLSVLIRFTEFRNNFVFITVEIDGLFPNFISLERVTEK
jgi:hypothetical protein